MQKVLLVQLFNKYILLYLIKKHKKVLIKKSKGCSAEKWKFVIGYDRIFETKAYLDSIRESSKVILSKGSVGIKLTKFISI